MTRLVDTFWGDGAEACNDISSPTIYRVTTTSDTGAAGSLRYALQQSGHRIVVFTTGGTFETTTPIVISSPYCIVMGHTAPSDSGGVTLKPASGCRNAPLLIKASNVIVRHVRFRSWDSAPWLDSDIDAMTIYKPDTILTDILFDHCSFSWAPDEVASAGSAKQVTFQWCIFSEALLNGTDAYSGKGFHSGQYKPGEQGGYITYYGCLFAHNGFRNPSMATLFGREDMINCVVYDAHWTWCQVRGHYTSITGYSAYYVRANIIKNYFKLGPNSRTNTTAITSLNNANNQIYASSNRSWLANGDAIGGSYDPQSSYIGTPPTHAITPVTAEQAYSLVLANAGARVPHLDSVDARILEEVQNGTGIHPLRPQDVGGWPTLAAGTAWTDSDSDGLPDSYETAQGGGISPTGTNGAGMLHILAWGEELLAAGGWDGDPDPGDVGDEDLPDEFDIYHVSSAANSGYYDSLYANTGSLYAGDSNATIYDARACVRFTDISIPQGYTVAAAYLEMRINALAGSGWSVVVVGEDADDSDAFVGTIADFEDRFETNATTATVADTIASSEIGAWWRSPDIASIINEITARGSWSAGNALSLCVEDAGAGYDALRVITFGTFAQGYAPRLLVQLAAATGGGGESGSQELQVAAATHDKWRRNGTALSAGNFAYVGDDHSGQYDGELVVAFQLSEDIPGGAEITQADLGLYIYAAAGANFDLDIAAEDASAPTIPVADNTDLDGRSFVTATNWTAASVTASTWLTIDVTTTIQALVDSQGDLSSGDYINLLLSDVAAGWNSQQRWLTIYQYDYTAHVEKAPKLDLAWSVAAGGGRAMRRGLDRALRRGMSI